eukprot:g8447.t1
MSNSKKVASNLLFWIRQYLNKPIYKNIQIQNFTTSWKDGLAFCALVHCSNSTVFDYTKLESKNQKANLELAFSTAKTELGVEPLLDADDFLILDKPDRRSVMTYVMMIRKGINTSTMMMRKIGKPKQQIKPVLPKSKTVKPKPKLVLFDTRSKSAVTTTSSNNNSNTIKDKDKKETSITSIKKTLSIKTRARRRSSVGNNVSLGRVIGTSATTRAGTPTVSSKTNQSDNNGTTSEAPICPSLQTSPTNVSVTKSNNNSTANNKSSPASNTFTTTKDESDEHIGDELQASQYSNSVLKSGWMLKAGKLNTALKNRYFILKSSSLTWYKQIPILMNENLRNTLTEEDILLEEKKVQTKKEQYQGRIRINDIKAVNIVIDKDIAIEKQYMLELVTKKRILKMYTLSPDILYDWKDALSNSLRELYKFKKQLSLSKIENNFIIIDDHNEDEDNDRKNSINDRVSRSSWNKRMTKMGSTGRLSTFSLDFDNDMNDAFPHVPAINKLTDELSSLIQIIGFNCDSLSFELRRVGVEEEKGILAIINSLTKKLNHATDIQKQLLLETTSHSSYMSKIREQSIQNWMKSSDASGGTIIEGYLKKCDFKRKTDIRTWYASRGDMKYQTRWFSLEKNTGILKYYKENPDILRQKKRNSIFLVNSSTNIKPKGVLSLKDENIQYVRKSEAPKAPPFSFDLVSSTKIFTLVATSLEEQIAWCTVLTRQLKKIKNDTEKNE